MRLILVRHGQTPANVNGIIQSAAPGPGLTELGLRQAQSLPAALAGEPIESISVSKLIRTHLTAAPLAEATGLVPVERPGLHEIEAGDTEGQTSHEAVRAYLSPMRAWADGDLDAAIPGAFDGHHFYARFDADVAAIAAEGWNVAVVVSHGAAIRAWVGGRGSNIDPHFAVEHELDNTGVAILEGSPTEGWTLISWQGEPVGGPALEDVDAGDPTGAAVD